MKTSRQFRWIAGLVMALLLVSLLPKELHPLVAQEHPQVVEAVHSQPGDELPDSSPGLPPTDQPGSSQVSQVISATEANVVQNGNTYTWSQDTRADWETGSLEELDSVSISGTLQLMQQYFGESETLLPLDESASGQREPVIAVDGAGNTYAVWIDQRNGNQDIYFAYRPMGGSWEPSVQINDDQGAANQSAPTIAADESGNAYALWSDERNGDKGVYFAYRPVGGDWQPNARVNDATSTIQDSPSIAVDDEGNAYALGSVTHVGQAPLRFQAAIRASERARSGR